jgi:hypothetical protein
MWKSASDCAKNNLPREHRNPAVYDRILNVNDARLASNLAGRQYSAELMSYQISRVGVSFANFSAFHEENYCFLLPQLYHKH